MLLFSVSQFAHFVFLGMWGIYWLLVGYRLISYSAKEAVRLVAEQARAPFS